MLSSSGLHAVEFPYLRIASRGIVVSVLGYHSDIGSSNPAEVDCENFPYKGS